MSRPRTSHLVAALASAGLMTAADRGLAAADTAPRSPSAVDSAAAPASPARQAFENLKQLAGTWEGESTRGWKERVRFEVIAGGTAVLEVSDHSEAHPGDHASMATVYTLDGERLILTHYCIAGNQPRMVASTIEPGAREITFTFLDATNLKSRDEGHMDRAVIRLLEPGRFTARWTWYEAGADKWAEDMVFVRQG